MALVTLRQLGTRLAECLGFHSEDSRWPDHNVINVEVGGNSAGFHIEHEIMENTVSGSNHHHHRRAEWRGQNSVRLYGMKNLEFCGCEVTTIG